MIVLVRHARAGRRGSMRPDAKRPLDERGRRQAERLVALLAPFAVERILTSAAVRCLQTVEPLARRLAIEPELRDELAEGTPAAAVRNLIAGLGGVPALLCTHGDITTSLLDGVHLRKGHAAVLDPARGLRAGHVRGRLSRPAG